jgi:hypothetical protein
MMMMSLEGISVVGRVDSKDGVLDCSSCGMLGTWDSRSSLRCSRRRGKTWLVDVIVDFNAMGSRECEISVERYVSLDAEISRSSRIAS